MVLVISLRKSLRWGISHAYFWEYADEFRVNSQRTRCAWMQHTHTKNTPLNWTAEPYLYNPNGTCYTYELGMLVHTQLGMHAGVVQSCFTAAGFRACSAQEMAVVETFRTYELLIIWYSAAELCCWFLESQPNQRLVLICHRNADNDLTTYEIFPEPCWA